MHQYRWLRALARGLFRLILLLPIVALLFAVLVDRGPSGNARLSLFPMAIVALDPFAWICFRNTLIFATVNTFTALFLGIGLGSIAAPRRFWGRAASYGVVAALTAAAPAFLALGVVGLLGPPYAWPWPFSRSGPGSQGASLESWRGLSLWLVWFWTSLPASVAVVMVATVSAIERLEPSWDDAARLAGARTISGLEKRELAAGKATGRAGRRGGLLACAGRTWRSLDSRFAPHGRLPDRGFRDPSRSIAAGRDLGGDGRADRISRAGS